VATEFGISRAPAREALQRLEEMNLVRKTHLGREVVEFSPKEFQDIYELKNVVEAFGTMKGALNTNGQDIEKIQTTLDDMTNCTNSGELKKLKYLNYQFHDLMVKCSENQRLIDTYFLLVKQIRWATSLSLELPDRPKQSLKEHQAIFEAFKQEDGEKVRIILEAHSNGNMRRILTRIESAMSSKSKAE